MTDEVRTGLRINPPKGSLIKNILTERPLGDLLNVSYDGFMVSSFEKIESGQIFQLQLLLTTQPELNISIGAECMWTESHGSDMDLSGFYIMDISESDQAQLDQVLDNLIKPNGYD